MKKITKIIMVIVTLSLVLGLPANYVYAKYIYFAGVYEREKAGSVYSAYMSEYSDTNGKNVGYMEITESTSSGRIGESVSGELIKISENKYYFKDVNRKFTVKVYKNKIVVKQNKKSSYAHMSGTYKLYERYPMP